MVPIPINLMLRMKKKSRQSGWVTLKKEKKRKQGVMERKKEISKLEYNKRKKK
jgi:hypothetical protein